MANNNASLTQQDEIELGLQHRNDINFRATQYNGVSEIRAFRSNTSPVDHHATPHQIRNSEGPLMSFALQKAATGGNISNRDFDLYWTAQDIQSVTYMGNTVLHILATYEHTDLLPICYAKNPGLLISKNKKLETPLHCAAKAGHTEVVSKLIELARIEGEVQLTVFLRAKNHNGETALHEAARHGHADVVSKLMREDPDLAGVVNNDKISPLYMAISRGSIRVVQEMRNFSDRVLAPPFFAGPNGQTALHAAVLRDAGLELQKELGSWLLKKLEALIQSKDNCFASSNTFTDLVLQLSSVEPLAKVADDTGNTPLHIVASVGCRFLAEFLLDCDSSLAYLRNSDGLFPVHVAASMGHVKTIIVFLKRCRDSSELFDNNGRNFFHVAAEENKYEVFVELLEKSTAILDIPDSDKIFKNMINTQDSFGNTPLLIAAQKGNRAVIGRLLKYRDSDLSLQNKEGLAAIDILTIEQYKKSFNEGMPFSIEECIKRWGNQLSPAWFEHHIVNNIQRPEATEVERSSLELSDRVQILGLGSVLIATVAFAAAFTLPGGYDTDNGIPVLGGRYAFKAFILADVLAFALSFLSTIRMIFCSTSKLDLDQVEEEVENNVTMFTLAAKCLAMAMALGLYVVLAPVNIGITIVAFVVLALLLFWDRRIYVYSRSVDPNLAISNPGDPKFSDLYNILHDLYTVLTNTYVLIILPLLFIFAFALL